MTLNESDHERQQDFQRHGALCGLSVTADLLVAVRAGSSKAWSGSGTTRLHHPGCSGLKHFSVTYLTG